MTSGLAIGAGWFRHAIRAENLVEESRCALEVVRAQACVPFSAAPEFLI
jgi:hypothetical protein